MSKLLIAGPTAVGKSAVASLLAEQLGGEIVSVDSMQVYRGMDIGTAKPTLQERERIRHHLIDVADISENFDVSRFCTLANQAISDIQRRGKVPILCGGTGLYFRALMEGLGESPAGDPTLRSELQSMSLEEMVAALLANDPSAQEHVDLRNRRRVIRALEVVRTTGKPLSELRASWKEPKPTDAPPNWFCLTRTLPDLRERIRVRVLAMFDQGLVEETRTLIEQGLTRNITASLALGYRQVIEHLQTGLPLPRTVDLVTTKTRQYAKRQLTWFRNQMALNWIVLEPDESVAKTAEKIAASFRSASRA